MTHSTRPLLTADSRHLSTQPPRTNALKLRWRNSTSTARIGALPLEGVMFLGLGEGQ